MSDTAMFGNDHIRLETSDGMFGGYAPKTDIDQMRNEGHELKEGPGSCEQYDTWARNREEAAHNARMKTLAEYLMTHPSNAQDNPRMRAFFDSDVIVHER